MLVFGSISASLKLKGIVVFPHCMQIVSTFPSTGDEKLPVFAATAKGCDCLRLVGDGHLPGSLHILKYFQFLHLSKRRNAVS